MKLLSIGFTAYKNWQISFPCCCNLLVFSSLSVGSWKVTNFFLSWLLSSLIFLLSQNSPSCFSVSYIPPSFIGSFPLLGFFLFLFLFLFMFHLQGFGVLLLLWVMSVKVESMNVVTKTRDICMYMGEIKRCNWAEKSLEDALNCSLTSLGGCYYACNSLSNSHLSTLLHICLTNMGNSFKLDVWVDFL